MILGGNILLLTTVYFVRHAHSTYTPDELRRPLSTTGFIDAKKISELLEIENIDVVISSPYERAIQTVEKVAQDIDKKIIIKDAFKERILSISPVEDFNGAITKLWEDPSFSWDGGESNIIAQKRGIESFLNVLDMYEGKNIVVGTHGNIMVLMMSYFDEKYDFSFWKRLDMPDIYKLTFDSKSLKNVERVWHRT